MVQTEPERPLVAVALQSHPLWFAAVRLPMLAARVAAEVAVQHTVAEEPRA